MAIITLNRYFDSASGVQKLVPGHYEGNCTGMVRFFHPLLTLLASSTRQELVAQIQYLKAENEILRNRLPKRVIATQVERARLVRLGLLVGTAIAQLVTIVKPKTFARWVRQSKESRPSSGLAGLG